MRQLCASEHPATAVSSGLERVRFVIATRNRSVYADLVRLPKLRVAGSNPVVRFKKALDLGVFRGWSVFRLAVA